MEARLAHLEALADPALYDKYLTEKAGHAQWLARGNAAEARCDVLVVTASTAQADAAGAAAVTAAKLALLQCDAGCNAIVPALPLLATWMELQREVDAITAEVASMAVAGTAEVRTTATALAHAASHMVRALDTTQWQLHDAMSARDAAEDEREAACADVQSTKQVLAAQTTTIASLTSQLAALERERDSAIADAMAASSTAADRISMLQAALAAREGDRPTAAPPTARPAPAAAAATLPAAAQRKRRTKALASAASDGAGAGEGKVPAPVPRRRAPAKAAVSARGEKSKSAGDERALADDLSSDIALPVLPPLPHAAPMPAASAPAVGSKRLRHMATAAPAAEAESPAAAAPLADADEDGTQQRNPLPAKRSRRAIVVEDDAVPSPVLPAPAKPSADMPAAAASADLGGEDDGMGSVPPPKPTKRAVTSRGLVALALAGEVAVGGPADENTPPAAAAKASHADPASPAPGTAVEAVAPKRRRAQVPAPTHSAASHTGPRPLPLIPTSAPPPPAALPPPTGLFSGSGGLRLAGLMAVPKLKAAHALVPGAAALGGAAPRLR